ncbi:MAG TPA: hypothetical protein VFJ30_18805, partial [Phycisphaerae bacterium]|nr:hypothetical protein [Phycisphaerae bacterium]
MVLRAEAPAVASPKALARLRAMNHDAHPSPALMQRSSTSRAIGPAKRGRSGSALSSGSKLRWERLASNPPPLLPRTSTISP